MPFFALNVNLSLFSIENVSILIVEANIKKAIMEHKTKQNLSFR
jgi:hypothetical protein